MRSINKIKHLLKTILTDIAFLLFFSLHLIILYISYKYLYKIAIGHTFFINFVFLVSAALFMQAMRFCDSITNKINARVIKKRQHKAVLEGILAKNKSNDDSYLKLPEYISDLLVNGQKTIATIVDVEYLPAKHLVKQGDLNLTSDNPRFLVKYKFCPPDANLESDLIHTITVFTEPGRHYCIGEPIPILYKVYDHDTIEESVRSMIYPAPLDYVCEECISCLTMTYYNQYDQLIKRYKRDAPKAGISLIEALINNHNNKEIVEKTIHELICNPFPILNNPFNTCDYLLELLSIFITIKGYKEMHANCIRLMFLCFEQSDKLMSRMYDYLMGYLNMMCRVGNLVSPDALELLCEPNYIEVMERQDERLVDKILSIYQQSEFSDSIEQSGARADAKQTAENEPQEANSNTQTTETYSDQVQQEILQSNGSP